MTIAITGSKIHGGVRLISAQGTLDQADGFEKVAPIQAGYLAHTGDNISNREIRCGLSGVFLLHKLVKAHVLFCQPTC